MSVSFPPLFDAGGPVPTPPAVLLANLLELVASIAPGYTANLPGSLIEDMSSTSVGALVTIDQARVDAINSVTPYAANSFILAQQGVQYGVPAGTTTNGSVFEVFSGSVGYVIPPGFIVSDGTNQYEIQDGGTIGGGGDSQPLFAVATTSASFPIPANSVTTTVTTVSGGYTLTVTNPLAGTPAQAAETPERYRARLLMASQVAIAGTPTYIKTLLLAVPGVSPRLISILPNSTKWEVICGGGDPKQVAGAIYQGVSTPGFLVGSATGARNITVSLYDAPNTYSIVYVNPPQQAVTVAATWNTTLPSFTAAASVNQYIIAALQSYINSIPVGQPINELVMAEVCQIAVAPVLAVQNLTTLTFAVTINGVSAPPTAGTSIIPGDAESYFAAAATAITSAQG